VMMMVLKIALLSLVSDDDLAKKIDLNRSDPQLRRSLVVPARSVVFY
jgi:hypothetical protein